jgi:hypothetical protein
MAIQSYSLLASVLNGSTKDTLIQVTLFSFIAHLVYRLTAKYLEYRVG